MEEQVERLVNINETLRKNLSSLQTRVNLMAKEKAEYEAELEMIKFERTEQDEEISDDVGVCIEEELARMDAQFAEDRKADVEKTEDGCTETIGSTDDDNARSLEKDPNRPRYTKAELQEILTERNRLKEECFSLREELSWYKPRLELQIHKTTF